MKYFKLIILTLLTFSVTDIQASHILGGDMTVVHVSDNTFRVTMTVYRDCLNGLADFDDSVTLSVFEEVTDTPLPDLSFAMNLGDVSQPTLGDECFTPDLCLEIGVYELEIELPDRANGYYLVWERCCRVAGTTNLDFADDFGMVFVATVPDPAIENSNPVFSDYPASGYFCVGIESAFSFGAVDADGDSLVYILDEPIHGTLATNTNANPNGGGPKPSYTNVPWAAGYALNDVLGSGTPLTVDPNTGLVVGTAAIQGQFCFGVIVEEWRDGVKIGEVRRELNVFSSADCNQIVDLGINGGVGFQTENFLAFNLNSVDVIGLGTDEDTISVTAQSDIFIEGNYDVLAFFLGDTMNYTLEGEWEGLIRWDSLTCDMIRDEPYYVEVFGT